MEGGYWIGWVSRDSSDLSECVSEIDETFGWGINKWDANADMELVLHQGCPKSVVVSCSRGSGRSLPIMEWRDDFQTDPKFI